MIQKHLVYQKSSKGSEAIANRQLGLSPKLRSALILIDGKRSFEDLARLSQALGDMDQMVTQLLEQGLIEPAPAAAPTAGGAKAAAAVMTPSGKPFSMGEAQRFASKKLFAILGPSAEPAALKIEAARTLQDLEAALKLAEVMVNDVRSSKVASEFVAEMQAHMPATSA